MNKLQEFIGNCAENVLFAGIGNVLRSDDGAGVYICKRLKPSRHYLILVAETAIENYIGKINQSGAGMLILVDIVDFGKDPGYYDIIPAEELTDFTLHTHNISLKKISELFIMPAWILGIQPADTSFGEELTGPVRRAALHIIQLINQAGSYQFSYKSPDISAM